MSTPPAGEGPWNPLPSRQQAAGRQARDLGSPRLSPSPSTLPRLDLGASDCLWASSVLAPPTPSWPPLLPPPPLPCSGCLWIQGPGDCPASCGHKSQALQGRGNLLPPSRDQGARRNLRPMSQPHSPAARQPWEAGVQWEPKAGRRDPSGAAPACPRLPPGTVYRRSGAFDAGGRAAGRG